MDSFGPDTADAGMLSCGKNLRLCGSHAKDIRAGVDPVLFGCHHSLRGQSGGMSLFGAAPVFAVTVIHRHAHQTTGENTIPALKHAHVYVERKAVLSSPLKKGAAKAIIVGIGCCRKVPHTEM